MDAFFDVMSFDGLSWEHRIYQGMLALIVIVGIVAFVGFLGWFLVKNWRTFVASAVALYIIYSQEYTLGWLVVAMVVATVLLLVFWFIAKATDSSGEQHPLPWRDGPTIANFAQVGFLAALYTGLGYVWSNFVARTDEIGLELNFDFLDQPGGISIADSPLSANDSVREAILTGFGNTIRIILIGIPLALLLGTLVGIARLSTNWLLRKIATGYVELIRNIPPLVVIVFVWQAVYLNAFPPASRAWKPIGGWFILSNNRFAVPSIRGLDNFGAFQVFVLVGLVAAVIVWFWRTRVFNETGSPHRRVLWSLGTLFGVALVGYVVLGAPVEPSKPMLDADGRVFSEGIRMQMPYAAVTTALVLYTATHISEIVRGSILAVHKGQVEAANALALSGFQRYRFVILPQAMRIAFPPLINQMLNFSKNSSLAIAIGFAEVTAVINNLFGQSQPAPQLILVLMLAYVTLSLLLSALGNVINKRLELVGR